jgi:hypothetical protein
MEQQLDDQGSLPMSFTTVVPELSAGCHSADGKLHQHKDQSSTFQQHAHHTSRSSSYLPSTQSFIPTTVAGKQSQLILVTKFWRLAQTSGALKNHPSMYNRA